MSVIWCVYLCRKSELFQIQLRLWIGYSMLYNNLCAAVCSVCQSGKCDCLIVGSVIILIFPPAKRHVVCSHWQLWSDIW